MNLLKIAWSILKAIIEGVQKRSQETQDLKLAEIQARKEMVLSKQLAVAQWELAQLVDKDTWLRRGSFVLFASPFWAGFFGPDFHHYTLSLWHSLTPLQENILAMICAAVFGRKTIPNFIGGTVQAVAGGLRRRPVLPEPGDTLNET